MSGVPVNDDHKPFYALAHQVGGELKGILSKDELDLMLQDFSDSMQLHH
jgi:hypothetical protein